MFFCKGGDVKRRYDQEKLMQKNSLFGGKQV
jgi:hypothetical protein